MIFNSLKIGAKIVGRYLEVDGVHIVFGNRHLSKEELPKQFPAYKFCWIQQVHGAELVNASTGLLHNADAHWSQEKKQALVIQTADCVPILLRNQNVLCAIHAGWRGLAAQIISRSIQRLNRECRLSPLSWQAFIGPHIGPQSFEVGREILPTLLAGIPTAEHHQFILPHPQQQKSYVHLKNLTQHQLMQNGVADKNIFAEAPDTYQSPDCASFRKSGGSKERQFSFIVRL